MTPRPNASRQLFDVDLEPMAGSRFQPTGFPDLGAALFKRPGTRDGNPEWVDSLLVESPQSVANRLEAAGWDEGTQQPAAALDGLPYVRIVAADDGRYLTSSRTEAHRLASAFVKYARLDGREMRDVLKDRLSLRDDTPLASRDIAAAVARLDPMCLVHGVFFAEKSWPAQPRIARAVTAFIEALDVQPAISGGVKRDEVRRRIIGEGGGSSEGYGFVPFHRTEYTARRILASFCIDLTQIRSYGLPAPGADLLIAIARWEIRTLLDAGLRLRTACDLRLVDPIVKDRDGVPLPEVDVLEDDMRTLIGLCGDLLGDGQPTEVIWSDTSKKRPEKKTEDPEGGEAA